MDGPGANAGLAGALAGWVGALTGDPLLVLATLLGLITPPGGFLIYLTAAQAGAQVHHEVRELVAGARHRRPGAAAGGPGAVPAADALAAGAVFRLSVSLGPLIPPKRWLRAARRSDANSQLQTFATPSGGRCPLHRNRTSGDMICCRQLAFHSLEGFFCNNINRLT